VGPFDHVDLHALSSLNLHQVSTTHKTQATSFSIDHLNFKKEDIHQIHQTLASDIRQLHHLGSQDFALNFIIRPNKGSNSTKQPHQYTSQDGQFLYEFWLDDYLRRFTKHEDAKKLQKFNEDSLRRHDAMIKFVALTLLKSTERDAFV